ncbi:branched-chain amino acid ABC transporter permease [Dongia sedimenti]|uniref:Branched-chain amino acid ABC transporter permease n=1 Tax=Dongia sedimenti TaxID=3064282 RepID=A0ABU0YRJ3_9PROT|nr:branched-chain amino acid ABC transporter permease [Rhodospirillaceae bacterium R-7]
MSAPRNTFLPRFAIAALVGAALVALADANLNPYLLSIIQFIGLNIILAVSLNVTNGFIGLFSLGHPAFMTVGGYVAAILVIPPERKAALLPDLPAFLAAQEWSFLPALIAGGSVAALVALIVGFPVLRLRGHYLAVATLGLIFIVQSFAVNLRGVTRGALGLSGLPELTNLWWVYLFCLVTIYVCWQLKHSSLGRTMLAIRENELAASCLGVKVARMRILSFVLGAFLAGIAGGLWVHLVTLISPSSFSFILAFEIVVMVVLGGTGSITGAVLVAVVLSVLTQLLRPVEEAANLFGASQMIVAFVVLVVLITRPKGLFGTAEPDLVGWLLRPFRKSKAA